MGLSCAARGNRHCVTTSTSNRNDPAEAAESTAALVKQMTEQVSRLVKDEIKLAQMDVKRKGVAAGIGIGMFGASGVFAIAAIGCLTTALIAGLAVAFSTWLAALISAAILFAVAGIVALTAKKEVSDALPPTPDRAGENIKDDIQVIKESAHR
jgi:hypothetical protein